MTLTFQSGLSRRVSASVIAAVLLLAIALPAGANWPQWGGPDRNFAVEARGLADSWPESGPRQVWSRALGDGYSAIAVSDGLLYTMYRKSRDDPKEYTIALDARTGQTVWETAHPSPIPGNGDDSLRRFPGPHTTPLVCGDRLYAVSRNAVLWCLNRSEGSVLWSHDLVAEFGAQLPGYGYAASPIAYENIVVLPCGAGPDSETKAGALLAFDQATGKLVWKARDSGLTYASPLLINFDGQDQLVHHATEGLIGVDPASGKLLWDYALPEDQRGGATASPVWNGKDTIFFSSRTLGCAVRLEKTDKAVVAKELWSSRKVPMGMGTPVLVDEVLIGSKRGQPGFTLAVDMNTGKRKWLDRGFVASTYVHADGKLFILNQEGDLGVARLGSKKLEVGSRCKVTDQYSFAAPSLVGTTLYVRDEQKILALDLAQGAGS